MIVPHVIHCPILRPGFRLGPEERHGRVAAVAYRGEFGKADEGAGGGGGLDVGEDDSAGAGREGVVREVGGGGGDSDDRDHGPEGGVLDGAD